MPPIDPLDGTNYRVWKIRMEALLRSQNLWHTISPSDFSAADLAAAERAAPLPKIPMPCIDLLTGDNYRTWRTEVEGVMRILGVWDVVCPPQPSGEEEEEEVGDGEAAGEDGPAAAPVAVSRGESRKSAFASVIIFDNCSKASMMLILSCPDAAARWARLKEEYAPQPSDLNGLFYRLAFFVPPRGMGMSEMARRLDEIMEDIGEACEEERMAAVTRKMMLVSVMVRGGRGLGWDETTGRVLMGGCSYEEAVREFVACEMADARKAREAGGGGGHRRKRVRGGW